MTTPLRVGKRSLEFRECRETILDVSLIGCPPGLDKMGVKDFMSSFGTCISVTNGKKEWLGVKKMTPTLICKFTVLREPIPNTVFLGPDKIHVIYTGSEEYHREWERRKEIQRTRDEEKKRIQEEKRQAEVERL